MAVMGKRSEASTMQVLPPAMMGATTETSPSRPLSRGARMETTPVGSSRLKLKCEEDTGFTVEKTCWYLSHQPA
jgi:hypothetical protein